MKCAQAIHAQRQFAHEFSTIERYWFEESNNIVVLESSDLDAEADALEEEGYRLSRFHEPDVGDLLTAICVEPRASKRLSRLRLVA